MTASVLCEKIVERAALAGVALTRVEAQQLADYYELLKHWNNKINLSSLVRDAFLDSGLDRLLVEPIAIKGLIANHEGEWVDVGSGGGSPAIPLKIVCPARKLLMVESRSKKTAFLREAVRSLRLEHTTVWTGRVEDLPEAHGSGHSELVTIRALKLSAPILSSVASLLRPGGRFAIFGSSGPPALDSSLFSLIESTKLPGLAVLGADITQAQPGRNAVHWFARLPQVPLESP